MQTKNKVDGGDLPPFAASTSALGNPGGGGWDHGPHDDDQGETNDYYQN